MNLPTSNTPHHAVPDQKLTGKSEAEALNFSRNRHGEWSRRSAGFSSEKGEILILRDLFRRFFGTGVDGGAACEHSNTI